METRRLSKKSKSKGKKGVDYDASRFTSKNEEKLYNKVWIWNGVFKAESALTLCHKRKYNPETKKGKEKLCSWVCEKKLKVTPDTFAKIYEIPREDNPEFEFLDVGMPDLAVVSQKLLLEGDEWDGLSLEGPLIDLHYLDLRGKGKRENWRQLHEEPPMGMVELKEAIMNLGREMGAQMFEFKVEVNAHVTSLEEESRHHTTMIQEMKGMMIRMEAEYDDEEEEEED
ncbi:hypothetical protein Acr_00g0046290 [Actinidia rufa]|uniref:Uncharacterized protein n=1 Tax=Actinidia rufa TaxID=165716 RepID=A0A7J0DJE2_9ERIC|nr:hypothetical protein Acr_00g0046290 [Actinidia rufa]